MGKIRTRVIGDTATEEEQKKEQKAKAAEKKAQKKSKKAEVGEEVEVAQDQAVESESTKKDGKKEVTASSKKRGKKYQAAKKKTDKKEYDVAEAITLLKKIKYANFDETVELHMNVKEAGLRGEVSLPHSTGRQVRVAIVSDALIEELEKGNITFDILITHPSFMPKLAKFARVLGPKGLMPNPKAGTISTNPEEVAKKYSGGLLKWKSEAKFPLVHQMVGKISQEDSQIAENIVAFVDAVGRQNISQIVIKTTMSPGLAISMQNL